jgi:uncharacterized protein YjiS (DUF1127 family)
MSLGTIFQSALTRIVEADVRYREYRRIAELDEHRLADIGLSRKQLETGPLSRRQLSRGIATVGRNSRWITPD